MKKLIAGLTEEQWQERDFLVKQVARMRMEQGLGPLEGAEYNIDNLRKEYHELIEIEDLYSPTDYLNRLC